MNCKALCSKSFRLGIFSSSVFFQQILRSLKIKRFIEHNCRRYGASLSIRTLVHTMRWLYLQGSLYCVDVDMFHGNNTVNFIAIHSLQYVSGSLPGLDGYYIIDEYKIIPCVEEKALSVQKPWRTLVLTFPFEGIEGDNHHFENMEIGAKKASRFVSWFALITDISTRLAYSGFGRGGVFFKCWHCLASNYTEGEDLKPFDPDLIVPAGRYAEIKRPDFFSFSLSGSSPLKLPSDMDRLTRKLFSLPAQEQSRYINACSSYQYALEVWGPYPTVSIVALVSAVESMMADRFSSSYCEAAKRNCSLKQNVSKKFRAFFEQTLAKPLPADLEEFLTNAYSDRSSFVHRALMGDFGPSSYVSITDSKFQDLRSELFQLSRVVRAGLLQWLIEV